MLRHVASGPLSLFLSHTQTAAVSAQLLEICLSSGPTSLRRSHVPKAPAANPFLGSASSAAWRSCAALSAPLAGFGSGGHEDGGTSTRWHDLGMRVDGLWRSRLGSHPHWRRCAALLHGGASGHAWSASRGSHRAPLRSTDIPLAFVWTLHSARACPVPQSPRTCDVAALCASTADTCAGCAPGVRTCCCWPFSVRRCLRLQRTPPSAIPLSTCSSSVSCACHGVHRSRRWLGGSCHGGRTRLPSQLD